jgi:hypothetical protein
MVAMPSALRLLAVWIGVTFVAVTVAWFGLRSAIDSPSRVTAARPGFDNSIVLRTATSARPVPSPTVPKLAVAPATSPTPTVSPTPSKSPSPSPSPSKTAPPKPKATTAPTEKTLDLAGGIVQLERRNGRVEVKDVKVRPGYTGRGWREMDGTLVIEFTSNDHRSTVRAFVRNDCGLCTKVDEAAA